MNFFYSAGSIKYGEGYFFHRFYDFPNLPFVTKTLTLEPKKGNKWAILPIGKSVFNKVALNNIGFFNWEREYSGNKNATVSIAGTDENIRIMMYVIEYFTDIDSIEINYSCPNVKSFNNKIIPKIQCKLYLKLNHTQNPYNYDLDKIEGIRLNSIPLGFCGGSGKIAQKKNWSFIERYNKENLNVAGCSFTSLNDIKRLEDLGCTETGIGSIMLTNPKLVQKLGV